MSSLILDPVIILRIYFQLHIGIRVSSLVAQLTYDLNVCIFVQTVFTCNLPTFKCILWEEQSDFL